MIKLSKVNYSFSNAKRKNEVLKDIDLFIDSGEIFGIIGRSGAGKSTLVRTFNFLTRPNSGSVLVDGLSLKDLTEKELMLVRRKIGMIFQNFNLLNSKNVLENISLPLELSKFSKNLINKRVSSIVELVGLGNYRYRYPYELSGGQKQRVGIARALACEPKILLSDEATSALDPETTHSVLQLIKKLNAELNLTVVLITHQMEVIKKICHRVAVMDSGSIIETGSVIDLFLHPNHEITRHLIGYMSLHDMPLTLKKKISESFVNGNYNLFRFAYVNDNVSEPIFANLARKYNLSLSILSGQVEEIQGQVVGSLIVLLSGDVKYLQDALEFLKLHGVVFEELSFA